MSAYTSNGRPTQIISLPSPGGGAEDEGSRPSASHALDKLEGFVVATRQLEAALGQERKRTRKLQEELSQSHSVFDRLLKESESRNNELSGQENRLKAALAQHQEYGQKLVARVQAVTAEFVKVRDELKHYKAAWAGVLQREREAKLILAESEAGARRMGELESQLKSLADSSAEEKTLREQAERHGKSYQLELQNALVRLHSAEGKFAEISKEHQILSQTRRSFDEELAKIEQSMRERLQWEMVKEREKFQAELEKDAALERERFREQARRSMKAELERDLGFERERFSSVCTQQETEIARMKDALLFADKEVARARTETDSVRRDLTTRLSEAKTESMALETRMTEFQGQLEGLQSGGARVGELQTRIGQLSAESARLRQELEIEKARAARLEAERDADRARAEEKERAAGQAGDRARIFENALGAETARAASLETALVGEKHRFEETAHAFALEVGRLRETHPLRDLLAIKEAEIARLEGAGGGVRVQNALNVLIVQRLQLRSMIEEAGARLDEQLDRIREARMTNTVVAGPADSELS